MYTVAYFMSMCSSAYQQRQDLQQQRAKEHLHLWALAFQISSSSKQFSEMTFWFLSFVCRFIHFSIDFTVICKYV